MGTIDGLFGKVRSGILNLLYGSPNDSFYLRQIICRVQTGVGAVQRELQALQELDIIKSEKRGNQTHFKANAESPIYAEIKGIVQKMEGWMDVLQQALAPLKKDIEIAFIYGSYAARTQTAESDVDLFVLGGVDELALHRVIVRVEKKIAKTINYTLLSPKEYAKRRRERGGFIARILAGPKIMILGDTHEIR